jgi:biopolymer transport protein ExbD
MPMEEENAQALSSSGATIDFTPFLSVILVLFKTMEI